MTQQQQQRSSKSSNPPIMAATSVQRVPALTAPVRVSSGSIIIGGGSNTGNTLSEQLVVGKVPYVTTQTFCKNTACGSVREVGLSAPATAK
mmetsp:Transcript_22186/g.61649  ORF Transcript_22186/g.61649 Transcript_22186/m.61649 type:complete len:91 (+) Transcript_22186:1231-1503(+)